MRVPIGRVRSRSRRALASLAAAIALVGSAPTAARAADGVVPTRTVPTSMMLSRRHLDADVAARRLFEIGQRTGSPGMRVVARDLDSFAEVGAVRIPAAASGVGGWLSAVDELRHRMYVLYPVRHADDAAVHAALGEGSAGTYDEAARALFGVAVVDTVRLRLLGTGTLALLAAPQDRSESNAIGFKAMSYDRVGGRDTLTLVSEVPAGIGNLSVSAHTVAVHEVDVQRLLDPNAIDAVRWSYRTPQCGLVMARRAASVVYRSASSGAIFVPCRQGGAQGLLFGQPLETPGVVRVSPAVGAVEGDTSRFASDFFPVSGNLQYGVVSVDPVSERLLLQVDGSTTEAGIWVFDTRSASWLGIVSLPSRFANDGTVALGVDASYGRLYALSTGFPEAAVVSAGTRGGSVDQGRVDRIRIPSATWAMRPVVDPLRHRIVVGGLEGYIVLEDHAPPPLRQPASDPDANTTDVREGANTSASYVGGAQAYGARLRWVGGTRGADRNANTVWDDPPSELSPNTGGMIPSAPAPGTRDLHLARILHSTLSRGEASARATGAERDLDNTDTDLAGWTTYVSRWGGPDLSAQRWPYETVECTDFGGDRDKREHSAPGARVGCDRARPSVEAVAVDESLSQGTLLQIAGSRARTSSYRDPKRGVVAVAEAEAHGIDLNGVAGVGRIATRAETWATGRPRASNGVGAGSRFTRTIEDVWVQQRDGTHKTICDGVCDPETVRDALNRALGVRARVELPRPEPTRARGTDGGYEALIVRDPFERANEAAINDEADQRRLEVPGMVVTMFADGRVPSRVVASFAAVSTESHYGIFVLRSGLGFDPLPRDRDSAGAPNPSRGGPPGEAGSDEPGEPSGGVPGLLRKVVKGLLFMAASPVQALRAFGLWMFLAAPLLLLMRRRSVGGPP